MKQLKFILVALLLFPALVFGGEKEETYLKETMIPLAREFLQRIGQTNGLPFMTNQVQKYNVDYFSDRPGCMAVMRLTNGLVFRFHTETNKSEVWSFKNANVKTYFELNNPPKEKIKALQALNLRNKLNQKSAEALAKKYFKLLGHKEENFHPLDFFPSEGARGYWVSAPEMPPANERLLPYYGFTWYRKDVKLEKIQEGEEGSISKVMIEVSGIDLGLVSYSKLGIEMPIGSDF